MQSSNRKTRATPWFKSKETAVILVAISLLIWLLTAGYVTGQLEIHPTKLILKSDSCTFIQTKGINATISPESGTCSVILPFRAHAFDSGGRIFLGDQQISVPEHQIVAFAVLKDQPYTPEQQKLLYWFLGATALLIFMAFWDKMFSRPRLGSPRVNEELTKLQILRRLMGQIIVPHFFAVQSRDMAQHRLPHQT